MSSFIQVTNPSNMSTWSKLGSSQDFRTISSLSIDSRDGIHPFCALFQPIRTNNLRNFIEDVSLPTTIHYAIKVENIALKILAVLGALTLDILTLPFRLITCIPRACHNASQQEHLLHAYLRAQGAPTEVLESGRVVIRNVLINGYSTENDGEQTLHFSHESFSATPNLIETYWKEFWSNDSGMSFFPPNTLEMTTSDFLDFLASQNITDQEIVDHLMPQPRTLTIEELG